jgi:hypothetical protein
MDKNISFFSVLKNGYKDQPKKRLGKYILDEQLSNDNNQVYYNPKKNKLLYNVTGTHNSRDWITNAKLFTGVGFKESDRYKQSHQGLREAKRKYGIDNATITGHSQGGYTASLISSSGDKVLTLDKASVFGGKLRVGENYRTSGDIVSALDINRTNMKTLKNPSNNSLAKSAGKVALGVLTGNPIGGLVSGAKDILQSHDVGNIKKEQIFV